MYTCLLLKQAKNNKKSTPCRAGGKLSRWQTLGCHVKQKNADRELVWSVIHLDV